MFEIMRNDFFKLNRLHAKPAPESNKRTIRCGPHKGGLNSHTWSSPFKGWEGRLAYVRTYSLSLLIPYEPIETSYSAMNTVSGYRSKICLNLRY